MEISNPSKGSCLLRECLNMGGGRSNGVNSGEYHNIRVLNKLNERRSVFHSEADFQHSLAWEIYEMYPDLNIRLEKREEVNGEELYLDIFFISRNNKICALELEYKTKKLDIII